MSDKSSQVKLAELRTDQHYIRSSHRSKDKQTIVFVTLAIILGYLSRANNHNFFLTVTYLLKV